MDSPRRPTNCLVHSPKGRPIPCQPTARRLQMCYVAFEYNSNRGSSRGWSTHACSCRCPLYLFVDFSLSLRPSAPCEKSRNPFSAPGRGEGHAGKTGGETKGEREEGRREEGGRRELRNGSPPGIDEPMDGCTQIREYVAGNGESRGGRSECLLDCCRSIRRDRSGRLGIGE